MEEVAVTGVAAVTGAVVVTGVVVVTGGADTVFTAGAFRTGTVAISAAAITSTAAATHIITTIIMTITTTQVIPTVTIAAGIVRGSARTTRIPDGFGAAQIVELSAACRC